MDHQLLRHWHAASALGYRRRPTRVVKIGDLGVGGEEPIRVQTMTTTNTLDTQATVDQVLRCAEAGAEIVRITAPSMRDARNLGEIKAGLLKRGCRVPLVADIHFTPDAAMEAALHVEKVRINPGNFADSKTFKIRQVDEESYRAELRRIEDRFTPLVERCKHLGRAMRIGTNHGSLSDRILSRYGDTPLGMVESALEYLRIAKALDYHDIILSMKASNPKVMVQAYRLLAARLAEEGMDYPFHLGVTEAGEGEDGRIKSATGIGALLEDGLGDTVRVSLTEDPEREVPVAFNLALRYPGQPLSSRSYAGPEGEPLSALWVERHPSVGYRRRASRTLALGALALGGSSPLRVFSVLAQPPASLDQVQAWFRDWPEQHPGTEARPECLVLDLQGPGGLPAMPEGAPEGLQILPRFSLQEAPTAESLAGYPGSILKLPGGPYTRQTLEAWASLARSGGAVLLELPAAPARELLEGLEALATAAAPAGLVLKAQDPSALIHCARALTAWLEAKGLDLPLVLGLASEESADGLPLAASTAFGSLLLDGVGDGLLLETNASPDPTLLCYNILQAAGVRITKTEFISCPSCGRTLFDLQEVTARIKARTSHLSGVKIAIMGCIVNGPGEMADADFGYVGGMPGHVNLFVGKDPVRKGIPFAEAEDALVALIKEHGRWSEPKA